MSSSNRCFQLNDVKNRFDVDEFLNLCAIGFKEGRYSSVGWFEYTDKGGESKMLAWIAVTYLLEYILVYHCAHI